MKTRISRSLRLVVAALILAVGLAAAPGLFAQQAGGQLSLAEGTKQAWQQAGEGKLDEALAKIKSLAADAKQDTPLFTLRKQIESHESHLMDQRSKSLADFSKKMAKLEEHLKAGKLKKALETAIEAQSRAFDSRAMLKEPMVAELVSLSEKKAAELEAAGDWLRSLQLYRLLGGLYDSTDREKYDAPLKRAATRLSLLRLYTPKVWFEIMKQNAADEGEEAPEPWNWEESPWQTQLAGITAQILTDGLRFASAQHVESNGYQNLLTGGIETLEVFFTVKGLESEFPVLADAEKVKKFTGVLNEQAAWVAGHGEITDNEAREVIETIVKANKQTLGLPEAVIVKELGEGALGKLDEFTNFVWPHSTAQFDRMTKQSLSGVGIQLRMVDKQLTVMSPIENSPALAAGIKPGDKIVSVNGKSTKGMEIDAAVDKITGPEGTEVTLGIQTPGKEPRDILLKRTRVRLASVTGWERKTGGSWEYFIDPELKIGYINLKSFGPESTQEIDAVVKDLQSRGGLKGLILDLRANPGGLLNAAKDISDLFLKEGTIVSTTQKSVFGRPVVFDARSAGTYPEFPLVVLVNRFSASASEIVSGALKDHHRALIIGERSFGKGSVQNIFPIGTPPAYLKLTIAYYKLPKGQIIHRRPGQETWGVEPDVHVRMTDEQMITLNQARAMMDILRKEGDVFDPQSVLSQKKNGTEEAAESEAASVKHVSEILTRGLDPQLETALLLLKARVLGEPRS